MRREAREARVAPKLRAAAGEVEVAQGWAERFTVRDLNWCCTVAYSEEISPTAALGAAAAAIGWTNGADEAAVQTARVAAPICRCQASMPVLAAAAAAVVRWPMGERVDLVAAAAAAERGPAEERAVWV